MPTLPSLPKTSLLLTSTLSPPPLFPSNLSPERPRNRSTRRLQRVHPSLFTNVHGTSSTTSPLTSPLPLLHELHERFPVYHPPYNLSTIPLQFDHDRLPLTSTRTSTFPSTPPLPARRLHDLYTRIHELYKTYTLPFETSNVYTKVQSLFPPTESPHELFFHARLRWGLPLKSTHFSPDSPRKVQDTSLPESCTFRLKRPARAHSHICTLRYPIFPSLLTKN